MTDICTLGPAADPLDLLDESIYRVLRTGTRRRKPRNRAFAAYRNAYGAELASSQGGPETIVLAVACFGTGIQAMLDASDAIDDGADPGSGVLAAAREYHFTNPDDRDPADAILFTRQLGDQSTAMVWEVLDGDWDVEYEQFFAPYCTTGTLTLYCNRVS